MMLGDTRIIRHCAYNKVMVVLKITAGPCAGMKITVPRGQIAHVGRTRWADFSLPADGRLADVHFAIDYEDAHVRIRDSSGELGTQVNGQPVSEIFLHSGDKVMAGQSTFIVAVEGEPAPAAEEAPPEETGPKTAEDYCRPLAMSDEAKQLLKPRQPPLEYFDSLVAHELHPDAIRFLAYWLPKPVAVGWGASCVASVFGTALEGKHKQALDAASAWAAEPDEARRRAAEAAAEATNYEGPASFLAAAAVWSGGSIAPAEFAEVRPAEGLTAQAIYAALLMTAPWGHPRKAPERYQAFLREGRKLAEANVEV